MTSEIHAGAFVDSAAKIGAGVKIGPGAVVGPECEIGDGCEVAAHAILTGTVRLGARCRIGYGAVIGGEPQDLSYKGARSSVEVGDDTVIREYATVHRGTKEGTTTRIGNGCYLMAGAHVAHNCVLGDGVILVNNTLLAGYVTVEDLAFLGGATLVHQYVRIGTLAITRGGTRIGKDVPPFFMAVATNAVAGTNRIGLRRAGMSGPVRRLIQQAYDVLYRSELNVTQALAKLKSGEFEQSPEAKQIVAFIEGSKRGICRHLDAKSGRDSTVMEADDE